MAGRNRDLNSLIIQARDDSSTLGQDYFECYRDDNRDSRYFSSPRSYAPHFLSPVILLNPGPLLGLPYHHCTDDIFPLIDSTEQDFVLPSRFDGLLSRTPREIGRAHV